MALFETCSLRDPTAQVADAAGAVQARRPNHPWIHPAARSFFMDRTSPYIFLYEDTQQPYCASPTTWFLPSLSVHILKTFPFVHRSHFWVGRRVVVGGGGRAGGRTCREMGGSGLCDLGRQTASTGRWFLAGGDCEAQWKCCSVVCSLSREQAFVVREGRERKSEAVYFSPARWLIHR